jgi:hypothetical protein
VGGIAYVGHLGYRAGTDSFVAPIILSPDSDIVLNSKLQASQVQVERARTVAAMEQLDAELAAHATAIERLTALDQSQRSSRAFMSKAQRNTLGAEQQQRDVLGKQRADLVQMLREQEALVAQTHANAALNLVPKSDAVREDLAFRHLKLGLFELDRAIARADFELRQSSMVGASLAGQGPLMPELVAREEQMVHIQLELLKLKSEGRSKQAERATLVDKLAKIDELDAQLRARPIRRAADGRIDVAFVPYTQLNGVMPGAVVHNCTWGLFMCKQVGVVAEVVPGEVVLPDPWGNMARGQYAVLNLSDGLAARAKMLRVRALPASTGEAVLSKDALSAR